jgi:hypothetical protein
MTYLGSCVCACVCVCVCVCVFVCVCVCVCCIHAREVSGRCKVQRTKQCHCSQAVVEQRTHRTPRPPLPPLKPHLRVRELAGTQLQLPRVDLRLVR